MPTPADHNPIESQLAQLQPGPAGPASAPEAFLAGVRARRTRTIVTRSAVGVGALGLLAALTLRLPIPGGAVGPAPDPTPLVRGTGTPSPAADPDRTVSGDRTTLASFRELYTADGSIDSLLDGLPAVPNRAGEEGTFRLGDRDARWAEGL